MGKDVKRKWYKIKVSNINLKQGIIKAKHIQQDGECHIILIQDPIYNENIIVIKFYQTNKRALKYIKQEVFKKFRDTYKIHKCI